MAVTVPLARWNFAYANRVIVDRVRAFLEQHGIEPHSVVVACSGGIDSTALLLAFADLGGPAACAHVNHHLRGAESEGDERFVRELCENLGITLHVADGSLTPALIGQKGIEGAARDVREAKLLEIAGDRVIATAHQKNDQAETVMMRIMTGSGLGGLRAIHPIRDDGFIRPLLDVSRAEIEQFLESRGVVARTDSSNADPRFLRNRVRAVLSEFGSATIDSIASVARQASDVWPLVERGLDDLERKHIRKTRNETRFASWPDDAWSRQALLLRHIRRLGDAREISSSDLERLTRAPESVHRITVSKDLELIRRRGALVLRRRPSETTDYEVLLRPGWKVIVAGRRIRLRNAEWRDPRSADRTRQLIQLPDGAAAEFIVRNRRRGDRFQPLGLASHKKLKDFLIDRKIAPELRDSLPLVVWNGEIVLVAGVEVSERFKVTSPAGVLFEVTVEDESQEPDPDGVQR